MRAILAIGLVALAAGLAVQTLRLRQTIAKNQKLEGQIAELHSVGAAANASPGAANSSDGDDRTELLRLRNQVAQLRAATNELRGLPAGIQHSPVSPRATRPGAEFVPRESWTFAGYATPEAAFQSMFFAMGQRDYNAFIDSLSPEEADRAAEQFADKTPEQITEKWSRKTEKIMKITGYRVLDRDEISPEEIVLVIYAGAEAGLLPMQMKKINDQWKFAGVATDRR